MSAQTQYTRNTKARIHGSISDLREIEPVSRIVETAAGADFGIVMSRGTDKAKQAVIGGTDPIGISIRDLSLQNETIGQTTLKYVQKDVASLIRRGPINITCPTGCAPGDAVNYNTTTGVIDSGAPAGGEVALLGVEWDSVAAAGEVAVLRLTGEPLK